MRGFSTLGRWLNQASELSICHPTREGRGHACRAGTLQETSPWRRRRSAQTSNPSAATARMGWIGANHCSAPVLPRATRTNLLHTGHPTAKNETTPPMTPARPAVSLTSAFTSLGSDAVVVRGAGDTLTYVAITRPARIPVAMVTGHDHHSGSIARPKIGLGMRAAGIARASVDRNAAIAATPQRRAGQARRAVNIPPRVYHRDAACPSSTSCSGNIAVLGIPS
jgi:hypothetical protein